MTVESGAGCEGAARRRALAVRLLVGLAGFGGVAGLLLGTDLVPTVAPGLFTSGWCGTALTGFIAERRSPSWLVASPAPAHAVPVSLGAEPFQPKHGFQSVNVNLASSQAPASFVREGDVVQLFLRLPVGEVGVHLLSPPLGPFRVLQGPGDGRSLAIEAASSEAGRLVDLLREAETFLALVTPCVGERAPARLESDDAESLVRTTLTVEMGTKVADGSTIRLMARFRVGRTSIEAEGVACSNCRVSAVNRIPGSMNLAKVTLGVPADHARDVAQIAAIATFRAESLTP